MAQRRKQKTNGAVKNGSPGVVNQTTNGIIAPVVVPPFISRQDSRLSVKSLIESIENTSKQGKTGSMSGSNTSLNSLDKMENQQQTQPELPKNVSVYFMQENFD